NQFCVMEKCNIDLLSYIKLNRISTYQTIESIFPNIQWLQFIKQMLAGFVHLVSLGILHRDIKTDNILLSNMIVKISDFSVSINTNSMTKMPVRGSIQKSDIYMFGCLFYEIVHGGERIWNEYTTPEVVKRRLNGEKPIFSVPCEPWYINIVLEDCLAMKDDERSTFEQLLQKNSIK
ncbi:unnamed protein product, partial [Adineta steineri]